MVFDYTSYTFEFLFYFWISSLSSFSSFSSFNLLVFLFSPANIACSSIPLQVPAFALIRPALVASPSNTPIPPEFDYLSVSVWSLHLSWGKKKKDKHRKRTQSAYARPVSHQLSSRGALHASAGLQLASRLHRVTTSAVHPLFNIRKWLVQMNRPILSAGTMTGTATAPSSPISPSRIPS